MPILYFSIQNSETFNISYTFLPLTVSKLSNYPGFRPPRRISHETGLCDEYFGVLYDTTVLVKIYCLYGEQKLSKINSEQFIAGRILRRLSS